MTQSPAAAAGALSPEAPVTALKLVTEAYRKKLLRIGVETVGDLLRHLPRKYEDYSQSVPVALLHEGPQTVRVTVESVRSRPLRGGRRSMIEGAFADRSGRMKAVWFNQPWILKQLEVGSQVVLAGRVQRPTRGAGLQMQNPAIEHGEPGLHTGRLVPIYPETEGLTSRWLRQRVAEALPAAARMADEVPPEVERRLGLLSLPEALRQVHFPESEAAQLEARRRIAFRQLLLLRVAAAVNRERRARETSPVVPYDVETAIAIRDALPFKLTDAQRRAAHAIYTDMALPHPMARLLQGDVGSGKTAVAAMAVAMAARGGFQSLLMAPTEILAQQHARTLTPYLAPLDLRMGLLAGSTGARERRGLTEALAAGELDLLVGTHALLEPDVAPRALALVIADEQHRFGVEQRHALAKGTTPHVLSMTATPIPRTLRLTVYGDLDISVLDELPPGRRPAETRLVLPAERQRAYEFVREQVRRGRQAFVICPLVEASELLQVRSATGEFERLGTEVFPDLRVALVHGRMKAAEKAAVMAAFKAGETDVLVSTSVVEVGVDVPNATVMMIEGAERFGLAQLHQFRGRVGRGSEQSYCLLLSDADNPDLNRRLTAMVRHASGFDLAEIDLQLRGPGDTVGTMQSGTDRDGLLVAGITDSRLTAAAQEEAARLVAEGLDRHPALRDAAATLTFAGSVS